MEHNHPVIIIGAGPAGLTAAYELVKLGMPPIVLEQADKVGGIARTEIYKGYRFDIGGHRFFTKVEAVQQLWHSVLAEDFIKVPRLSRIYYRGRFFNYPLDIFNTLSNIGIWESLLILLSYLGAKLFPSAEEETLEQWVTNRFGSRLFRTFFQTYTEKVWGIPCNQIQADWAAQRIKGLSLKTAILNAVFGTNNTKTLIKEFYYPVKGPGMMWERFQAIVEQHGAEVWLNARVISVNREGQHIQSVTVQREYGRSPLAPLGKGGRSPLAPLGKGGRSPLAPLGKGGSSGEIVEISGEHFISTMPVTALINRLSPPPPAEVVQAANQLKYRALIIVALIVNRAELFPDNWIYIHSPEVKVGRIQNFKNWSAAMVPDASKTCLGMEYFCSEGDAIWKMSDPELLDLATGDLVSLGLASAGEVLDGVVIRQPKAYPVYDREYRQHLRVIQNFLATIDNLQTIGRNGMHRYNNQDHSMLTGMLAVRNILGEKHDLWEVNTERSYYEEFTTEKLE